jgi:transposase InsO family protein
VSDAQLPRTGGARASFASFDDAAVALEAWECRYNHERFSMALRGHTPREILAAPGRPSRLGRAGARRGRAACRRFELLQGERATLVALEEPSGGNREGPGRRSRAAAKVGAVAARARTALQAGRAPIIGCLS